MSKQQSKTQPESKRTVKTFQEPDVQRRFEHQFESVGSNSGLSTMGDGSDDTLVRSHMATGLSRGPSPFLQRSHQRSSHQRSSHQRSSSQYNPKQPNTIQRYPMPSSPPRAKTPRIQRHTWHADEYEVMGGGKIQRHPGHGGHNHDEEVHRQVHPQKGIQRHTWHADEYEVMGGGKIQRHPGHGGHNHEEEVHRQVHPQKGIQRHTWHADEYEVMGGGKIQRHPGHSGHHHEEEVNRSVIQRHPGHGKHHHEEEINRNVIQRQPTRQQNTSQPVIQRTTSSSAVIQREDHNLTKPIIKRGRRRKRKKVVPKESNVLVEDSMVGDDFSPVLTSDDLRFKAPGRKLRKTDRFFTGMVPFGVVNNSKRNVALTKKYGVIIGAHPSDRQGQDFSQNQLSRVDEVLQHIPRSHYAGNPMLEKIMDVQDDPLSPISGANSYTAEKKRINMVRPMNPITKEPISRGFHGTMSARKYQGKMNKIILNSWFDDGTLDREQDIALGLGSRQFFGDEDNVRQGNLFKESLRHEMGHAVDEQIKFTQKLGWLPQFGGWRTHYLEKDNKSISMPDVANALLRLAGYAPSDYNNLTISKSNKTYTFLDMLGQLIENTSATDISPQSLYERLSDKVQEVERELLQSESLAWAQFLQNKQKLKNLCELWRIAAAHPFTLADGGPVVLNGRVYQRDQYGSWVSYLKSARQSSFLSRYQFSSPGEWFAEAYAAYYSPYDDTGYRQLNEETKRWFLSHLGPPVNPELVESGQTPRKGSLEDDDGRLKELNEINTLGDLLKYTKLSEAQLRTMKQLLPDSDWGDMDGVDDLDDEPDVQFDNELNVSLKEQLAQTNIQDLTMRELETEENALLLAMQKLQQTQTLDDDPKNIEQLVRTPFAYMNEDYLDNEMVSMHLQMESFRKQDKERELRSNEQEISVVSLDDTQNEQGIIGIDMSYRSRNYSGGMIGGGIMGIGPDPDMDEMGDKYDVDLWDEMEVKHDMDLSHTKTNLTMIDDDVIGDDIIGDNLIGDDLIGDLEFVVDDTVDEIDDGTDDESTTKQDDFVQEVAIDLIVDNLARVSGREKDELLGIMKHLEQKQKLPSWQELLQTPITDILKVINTLDEMSQGSQDDTAVTPYQSSMVWLDGLQPGDILLLHGNENVQTMQKAASYTRAFAKGFTPSLSPYTAREVARLGNAKFGHAVVYTGNGEIVHAVNNGVVAAALDPGVYLVYRSSDDTLGPLVSAIAQEWAGASYSTKTAFSAGILSSSGFSKNRAVTLALYAKYGVKPDSMICSEFAISCYQAAVGYQMLENFDNPFEDDEMEIVSSLMDDDQQISGISGGGLLPNDDNEPSEPQIQSQEDEYNRLLEQILGGQGNPDIKNRKFIQYISHGGIEKNKENKIQMVLAYFKDPTVNGSTRKLRYNMCMMDINVNNLVSQMGIPKEEFWAGASPSRNRAPLTDSGKKSTLRKYGKFKKRGTMRNLMDLGNKRTQQKMLGVDPRTTTPQRLASKLQSLAGKNDPQWLRIGWLYRE
ncbi:MAG: hypothetical protein AAF639_01545 [Chloroflexota bacterium]